MKALIQRVSEASVSVDGGIVGAIGSGLLVLLGVERDDDASRVQRLLERVLAYRVFNDEQGRMNLNVKQAGGGLLIVSQFTLVADTARGNRPSFTGGAEPARAQELYSLFVSMAREVGDVPVAEGRFAADMQVSLVNDGPVTFLLGA